MRVDDNRLCVGIADDTNAVVALELVNRQESDVLLIIAHRSDKVRVTRIIKEIDDTAFVTITKTSSVFGKNFDTLKL